MNKRESLENSVRKGGRENQNQIGEVGGEFKSLAQKPERVGVLECDCKVLERSCHVRVRTGTGDKPVDMVHVLEAEDLLSHQRTSVITLIQFYLKRT